MPSQHSEDNKVLGWRNPPPELAAWLREQADQPGVTISGLLTEAVTDLIAKRGQTSGDGTRPGARGLP